MVSNADHIAGITNFYKDVCLNDGEKIIGIILILILIICLRKIGEIEDIYKIKYRNKAIYEDKKFIKETAEESQDLAIN